MGNLLFSNRFDDPGTPTDFREKYINSEFSASQIPILFCFSCIFLTALRITRADYGET